MAITNKIVAKTVTSENTFKTMECDYNTSQRQARDKVKALSIAKNKLQAKMDLVLEENDYFKNNMHYAHDKEWHTKRAVRVAKLRESISKNQDKLTIAENTFKRLTETRKVETVYYINGYEVGTAIKVGAIALKSLTSKMNLGGGCYIGKTKTHIDYNKNLYESIRGGVMGYQVDNVETFGLYCLAMIPMEMVTKISEDPRALAEPKKYKGKVDTRALFRVIEKHYKFDTQKDKQNQASVDMSVTELGYVNTYSIENDVHVNNYNTSASYDKWEEEENTFNDRQHTLSLLLQQKLENLNFAQSKRFKAMTDKLAKLDYQIEDSECVYKVLKEDKPSVKTRKQSRMKALRQDRERTRKSLQKLLSIDLNDLMGE